MLVAEQLLDDGTNRTYICAVGDKYDVTEDMKSLIDYLAGKDADSNLTSRIDAKVKEAIAKSLWRKEYMTYKEHMDQEYNRGLGDGIEIGIAKGEAKGEAKGKISGRVIARYEDDMPIAEIAKKSGISEDEVRTILKDEGLI